MSLNSIVFDARRNGTINTLTPRIVRETLEKKHALETGILNDKALSIRSLLKSALAEAAEEPLPPIENAVLSTKAKKRKSDEMLEDSTTKSNEKTMSASSKPKKSGSKQYKSRETIPTSDIEEDVSDTANTSAENTSMEVEKPSAGPSTTSSKENRVAIPEKRTKPPSSKASGSKTKHSPRPSAASTPLADSDNESALSVLEDEPPKKKPKTGKSKQKGDTSKSSKGKKASSSLSKDEETIKRLKSLVVACGVRKQWGKIFKDVDSSSQQIKILKQTLTDLGMTGRMSLEQAKTIKAKREFAQELEDVQQFAAAAARPKVKPSAKEEEEEESEEEELPVKRKPNARKSIMDFLGDQSD
ncbi:E3 ubiquitin isg15 ligase trim25-like protein [Favolaschia claudopus]|uniref:E3 ubiquitin isg15 ligase trim25-like protein n=1 Tax=Favolaschia claudopus TaxID=2862362 RepID=A0AAW0DA74_9AGAR